MPLSKKNSSIVVDIEAFFDRIARQIQEEDRGLPPEPGPFPLPFPVFARLFLDRIQKSLRPREVADIEELMASWDWRDMAGRARSLPEHHPEAKPLLEHLRSLPGVADIELRDLAVDLPCEALDVHGYTQMRCQMTAQTLHQHALDCLARQESPGPISGWPAA